MSNSHDQLERDLRAALRSVDHGPVSADAWQQNQRRLVASPDRRLPRLLAAAAVVLVLLLVGGLLAVATNGRDSGTPANGDGTSDSSSSEEVFADANLLGPIVEVERLTVGKEPAVHEAALSDTSGKGPSLCDRVVAVSSESGGCTSREPNADKAAVAFDWLTGTMGSGNIRGVLAGVDKRVMKVQIWMDNGDMTLADLKPAGWEGTQLFALTVPADGPRPQRLVAYSDASGTVLQAVDLTAAFGDEWLLPRQFCEGTEKARWPIPGSGGPEDVAVSFGPTDALVSGSAGTTPACVEPLSAKAIAGWTRFGDLVVAVLAPETGLVGIRVGPRTVAELKPSGTEDSLWRVAVFRDISANDLVNAELIAFDVNGSELDREFLNQPASP
jgi:hypothetical protein